MPNLITWAAKQRYSDYGEIPDDELTLRYAEAHPQYLSDPEFKADYDRIMLSKQAAVPQPAPEPEAGLGESIARRAYGGLQSLGGALWKGGEYVSRAVGATDTAEEARLNYEYAKAEADAQRAKSAQTGIGKYAGMVAEALPSILPAIAVAPAGLAGMAVSSGVTGGASTLGTAEDAYKAKYIKEGFSEEEASAKARISALAPAAASGLATGLITRGFGAKGVEALASKAVTREAAKKLIAQNLPTALVKGATSEAIEEGVDQAAQAVIERMSYNPDLTLAEAVQQVVQAAFVGGALGGGVAGLRHPGEVRQAQAIVAQERKEAADKAAAEARINAGIESAVRAAREQQRIAEMTPEERQFLEQQRIAEEYQPILQAEEEIRAKMGREFKAAKRAEFEEGLVEAVRRENEFAKGAPSPEQIAAAEAEMRGVDFTTLKTATDLRQERLAAMTPEERQFLEQQRIMEENQPLLQAEENIRAQIRREEIAKFKQAQMEAVNQEQLQRAEAAAGIPSYEQIAAAEAEMRGVAPTTLETVTDPRQEIRKKVAQEVSQEEASQRLAAAAGKPAEPPPLPFLSQPSTPRNLKVVEGGKLAVAEAAFPEERQIEGQPKPQPTKGEERVQTAILGGHGYSTLTPGLEALTSANKPKPTPLKTAKQAADIRRKGRKLPPGAAMSLGATGPASLESEIDSQYFAALELGDTEAAQRIVDSAAHSAGYTKKVYHGSVNRFTKFREKLSGIWSAFDERSAAPGSGEEALHKMSLYADPGENPVKLTEEEFKEWQKTSNPTGWMRAFIRNARGPSGKRVTSVQVGDYALVVTKPSQLKSANAFTSDKSNNIVPPSKRFQKAEGDIRFSLGESSVTAPSGDHAMIKTVAKDSAPDESVDVVHDPDLAVEGRIVEGYVDENGRIVLNSAAPRMSDPAHVRMVVREERAHKLLNSAEGKDALNKFVGRLTPSEKANLQAEGYVQAQGETAGEYDVRLHNEFIAKQARENTTKWRQVVDRVRVWLSQFGLKLSNAEVARAILRQLNDSRASTYSIKGRKAGLTAKLKSNWIAQFSIVDGLQEALAATVGAKVTFRLSKMFERIAGASGEAEGRSKELRNAVADKIVGRETEFSQLASLNAALSRLFDAEGYRQKAAQLKAGKQSAETSIRIKNLEERADRIGMVRHEGELMDIPKAQKLVSDITARLKQDGSWAQVQEALVIYKNFMDADADMKYEAGLISESKWKHFKRADRFYMPYINMNIREDAPSYSGLKGRVGQISAEDKYKTALDAADHMFLSSYRHAAMNRAKLQLKKMAEYSNSPHLAQVVNEKAASDNVISGLQNGQPFYIKTDADTVAAVNYTEKASNAIREAARTFSSVQRFGATTASASFQMLNLLFSDIPNLALMSKAGIKNPVDAIRFIGSLVDGFNLAYGGNFGKPSESYLNFLKSGAAGGSLQSEIDRATSDASKSPVTDLAHFIGKFARTFEETTKIAGYKRLLKDAGVDSVSKLSVSDATNLIAEVRNFSGSPDFAVHGSIVNSAKLGTWLIFVPAALRGNATTMSRLLDTTRSGRTEYEREAARSALIKAGFFVGMATYAAYALNNLTDEMREEFDRIPEDEKRNNFMIPLDSYFTAADGSQVREFARIPKRGVVKILSNTIEDSMEYYRKNDIEHFRKMMVGAVESIFPMDISGKTPQERVSGAISSLNPILKVPLEYATGHNFFRRNRIVPRRLERAETSEQFTERTNENVRAIATAIGVSPLHLRNALDGMTGGLSASLLPEKPPQVDRGGAANIPVLSRFVRSARQDAADEGLLDEAAMKQATASARRLREAESFVSERKTAPIRDAYQEAVVRYGPENRDIVEKVKELLVKRDRGITVEDERVLQLSPPQRAEYILSRYAKIPEQGRKDYILSLRKKRVLTEDTAREMYRRGFRWN